MIFECEGCKTQFEVTGDFAFHACPGDTCQWVYWACGKYINSAYAPVPVNQVEIGMRVYIVDMPSPAKVLNVAPSTVKGKSYHIAIQGWGSKNCTDGEVFWVEQPS